MKNVLFSLTIITLFIACNSEVETPNVVLSPTSKPLTLEDVIPAGLPDSLKLKKMKTIVEAIEADTFLIEKVMLDTLMSKENHQEKVTVFYRNDSIVKIEKQILYQPTSSALGERGGTNMITSYFTTNQLIYQKHESSYFSTYCNGYLYQGPQFSSSYYEAYYHNTTLIQDSTSSWGCETLSLLIDTTLLPQQTDALYYLNQLIDLDAQKKIRDSISIRYLE